MIVEDNASIREDLEALISEDGRDVVAVANGLEALEQLRWGLRPAVILLDLRMSVMTGWEFRAEQKKDPALSSIPVVAMTTGQWKPADLEDFAARIAKPIDIGELQATLDRYCRRTGASTTREGNERRSQLTPQARRTSAGAQLLKRTVSVVLVDDNEEIRASVTEILEDEGFTVATAGNGRDALELIRKIGSPPCLILLDLAMPVMDGWQFLTTRRSDPVLRHIPVVILSAFAGKTGANTVGTAGVLAKPIQPSMLLDIVRAHCTIEPVRP